ncbi:MAG: dockerin type I domain-containing protein [Phycisphaerales bacterium]
MIAAASMAADCEVHLLPNPDLHGGGYGQSTAVSADGQTVIIGADGQGMGGIIAGAVYVYGLNNGAWVEQAILMGDPPGISLEHMGWSVAVSADGRTVIAGAPDLFGGSQVGSAWIFVRDGDSWSEQARLVPSGSTALTPDRFGLTVAMSADGNTIASGAPREDLDDGVAYVFVREETTWTEQVRLPAPEVPDARFGTSVALSGDGNTLLVGARHANDFVGAAYVFTRQGDTWTQQHELNASDAIPADDFGTAVAITPDATMALIGAPSFGAFTGAAYVFKRIGESWVEQFKIEPAGDNNVRFASSVAMSGDAGWLLANAPFDDDTGLNAGAVYVFRRDGNTWIRDTKLISCQTDDYGTGLAIGADGVTIAIGADQEEVLGFTSGAAYLYETANLCPDCDNNGFLDHCDLEYGTHQDCNVNGVPDSCDVIGGGSPDENANNVPDECEPGPCLDYTIVLTQNLGHEVVIPAGFCFQGGITHDARFARSYDLSAVTETAGLVFRVSCVEVGVYNDGLDTVGTVRVYVDTDGGDPVAPGVDLALVGQAELHAPAVTFNALLSVGFDPPLVIPPDSTIVAELGYTEGVETIAAYSGNDVAATGRTWARAASCNVPEYVPVEDVGYPDWQLVQRVRGDTVQFVVGDVNGDGIVDGIDVTLLLESWGACADAPSLCPADLNGDGEVGINDFLLLLASWG